MSKNDVPDELKGKEREIFGNLRQIFEWHKRYRNVVLYYTQMINHMLATYEAL